MSRGVLVNARSSDANGRVFFLLNFHIQFAFTLLLSMWAQGGAFFVSPLAWDVAAERGPAPPFPMLAGASVLGFLEIPTTIKEREFPQTNAAGARGPLRPFAGTLTPFQPVSLQHRFPN